MDDTLFQLRFTAKQLERQSLKAEKEQKVHMAKVKKALQQKNVESAQIYAENAIRKKNESLNYLRFAARVDSVSAKLQTGLAMQNITKNISGVCKALDSAMASMNLEQVEQIMSRFEKQFEDLDVRMTSLDNSMGAAMTLSTPQGQVEALMQQVAEESGLEMLHQLKDLNAPSASVRTSATVESGKEDDLTRRLQSLRN